MRLQAYEVVYQTMEKGEHSDSVFHRIVEQNDFLTRDKRFLKRLSYGTIERSVELDAILNQFAKIQVLKMTAPVRTVLRMALYEIRYMEKVPEAVSCHEAVELLKKKEGQKHTAFVNGVQKNDIGTSLKHFAANNQEWRRMSISAEIDERTLNEIYLTAFEKVVKQAQPWTIMCSYNQINGEYSCENKMLLTDTLRDKWGFKGLVMTDWGAMNDRVKALKAGLDLEMPSSHGETDKLIVKAVNNGSLDMETLDTAVRRILTLVDKSLISKDKHSGFKYDMEWHHAIAKETAESCAVLLKNNGALPLSKNQKIAFIGEFADKPRIQGGGSSHIN